METKKTVIAGVSFSMVAAIMFVLIYNLVGIRSDLSNLQIEVKNTTKNQKWEYMALRVPAKYTLDRVGGSDPGKINTIDFNKDTLGKLATFGEKGWQVVTSYLETETSFMNFGKEEFVVGLQPNIRPQLLVIVLKRKAG